MIKYCAGDVLVNLKINVYDVIVVVETVSGTDENYTYIG